MSALRFSTIFFLLTFGFTSFAVSQTGLLIKTVGTSPETCGTSQTITVTAGTNVYYCYEMRNETLINRSQTPSDTIPGALVFHSLWDNKLGQLLNEAEHVLNPGQSLRFTTTATISDTVTNTATWSAFIPFTTTLPTQLLVVSATSAATVFVTTRDTEAAPIPTLSEWGIILLAVLLFGTGLIYLKRGDSGRKAT